MKTFSALVGKTTAKATSLFMFFLPTIALCQTTLWTSSHPTIVSVNNNGVATVKAINNSSVKYVIITATTTQNSKTTTSTKQIEVNPYYPGCSEPSVYINNLWWASCDHGTTAKEDTGSYYVWSSANVSCASGWRLPSTTEYNYLINNCNSVYTTINGKTGRFFCSNTIFFPASGYDGSVNRESHHWTATNTTSNADCFYFGGSSAYATQIWNYPKNHHTFNIRCVKI